MRKDHIGNVPQETLDAIIDELADNRAALKTCCLVSRRWVWRSRHHLFKIVRFSSLWGLKSLRNWGAVMNINGTSLLPGRASRRSEVAADTPAALTTSLRLSQRGDVWITPLSLVEHLDHFRSFNRIESLTLSYFSCGIFDRTSLCALFRSQIPSVRRLRLHHPSACAASLLQFISVFPNLLDTMVHAPLWVTASHRDDRPMISCTLRGEIHLSEMGKDSGPFFSLLASQNTCYEQIGLEGCTFRDFYPLQSFVSNTGKSLRTLCIFVEGDRKSNLLH